MNKQSTQTSNRTHTRRSLRGQVMILFAVGVIVLIGGAALAVDVGFLMAERRQNQAAVDAAALSAAKSLLDKKTGEIQASGKQYGSLNAGVAESQVNVQWPAPGPGPFSGDEYVRVTITKDVQKFFLNAIYGGDWQVTNTAVAAIEPVPKPYALVALSPCPAAGIKLNGGVKITIDGGGSILSNCNVTNTAGGSGSSLVLVGGSIDAAGPTIESNPSWVAPDGLNPNMNAVEDPLVGTAVPPKGSTRNAPSSTCLGQDVCFIEPGYYLDQSFNVTKTVCMKPGIYYLDGTTKITFQNQGSILTNKPSLCPGLPSSPPGVMIYITGSAAIQMKNNSVILSTIYPIPPGDHECNPADAPYPGAPCGMVLWIANGSSFASQAGAVTLFDGVFYAPQSTVKLQGTPGTDSQGVQVIVGVLELGGNGAFNLNYVEYVKLDNPKVFLVE